MGFLERGMLEYVQIGSVSPQTESEAGSTLLRPTDFFCEAILWTKWRCRGNMLADTDCELLELNGDVFRQCVKQHQVVLDIVRDYGEAFVETLNLIAAKESELELTDVQFDYLNEAPLEKFLANPWISDLSSMSQIGTLGTSRSKVTKLMAGVPSLGAVGGNVSLRTRYVRGSSFV
eukprot:5844581-Amphidinium_carterae.2